MSTFCRDIPWACLNHTVVLIFFYDFSYILSLDVSNNLFRSKHQVFYLGPLFHSAMDNPKGFAGELHSALGELNFMSTNRHVKSIAIWDFVYALTCIWCVLFVNLDFPRCSIMEVVCGRRSVAQEPGGGTSDRGAGVQGGHAAHAGALHWTHSCHLHGSAFLWCWYGNQTFRL